MTTLRQIEANRRNAQLSTGPVTEEGKRSSRRNAVRHGLTAETVIEALEDPKDYVAFQLAVTADYDPQSAVERELILRLASLLWRLRRVSAIEKGLFAMHAHPMRIGWARQAQQNDGKDVPYACRNVIASDNRLSPRVAGQTIDLAHSFVRLCELPDYPLDRLSRYEARLWRQARQIILSLQHFNRHRRW
jgi:hypothetical protein